MRRKYYLIILFLILIIVFNLILFAEEIKYTFQNEPDGFRGLKWGDAPTEDMTFLGEISAYKRVSGEFISTKSNSYYRRDDKNNIGTAKLGNIFYSFNLYSNQFYKVTATFYGETNYNILKIIFEEKFGKPSLKLKDDYSLVWHGEKAKISLTFNSKEWEGFFMIESIKIHPESPGENRQKEIEKAKEDF